jgi:DNA gyrase subunit B
MPELIQRGHLYIAQPPLYLVKKGKKSRYLDSDEEKEQFLLESAVEASEITSNADGKKPTKLTLKLLLSGLQRAQERRGLLLRLERVYGIDADMAENALKLPRAMIQEPSKLSSSETLKLFGDDAKLIDTSIEQEELELTGEENGNEPVVTKIIRRGDQIDLAFFKSHEFHVLLDHDDPEEGIGKPPYRVVESKTDEMFETDDLLELHARLMEIGQKGITLQRYKGLGEMNADQLKITTMDPENRRLLRVESPDEAISSETFELLMGDQVEPRKAFIQKHAADVLNLDI